MSSNRMARITSFVAIAKAIEDVRRSIRHSDPMPEDFASVIEHLEASALLMLDEMTETTSTLLDAAMKTKSLAILKALPDCPQPISSYWIDEPEDVPSAEILEIAMHKGLNLRSDEEAILRAAINRPDLQSFILEHSERIGPTYSTLLEVTRFSYANCPEFAAAYMRILFRDHPKEGSRRLVVGLANPVCGRTVALCLLAGVEFDFDAIEKHIMVDNSVAHALSSAHARLGLLKHAESLEAACADPAKLDAAAAYIVSVAVKSTGDSQPASRRRFLAKT